MASGLDRDVTILVKVDACALAGGAVVRGTEEVKLLAGVASGRLVLAVLPVAVAIVEAAAAAAAAAAKAAARAPRAVGAAKVTGRSKVAAAAAAAVVAKGRETSGAGEEQARVSGGGRRG